MDKERFTVTEQHLLLARHMCVGWQDCEFGAPEIDPKRPYGNSDVIADIGEILGEQPCGSGEDSDWSEKQERWFRQLHLEMKQALQVALDTARFEVGDYEREPYGGTWAKV